MENASKALIIAGAILLAIVIISLGLIVVNNVRDTVDKTNMSEQEIQAFNAKFTAYEGDKVSGSRVNSLIQKVIATNQELYNEGKNNQFVRIGFPSITKDSNGNKYIVICKFGDKGTIRADVINDDTKKTISGISGATDRWDVKSSCSVNTGDTYKVEIGYTDGLVSAIAVNKN